MTYFHKAKVYTWGNVHFHFFFFFFLMGFDYFQCKLFYLKNWFCCRCFFNSLQICNLISVTLLDFQHDATCYLQYSWLVRSLDSFFLKREKSATVPFPETEPVFWNVQFCIKYGRTIDNVNPDIGFLGLFICFSWVKQVRIWHILYLNNLHKRL